MKFGEKYELLESLTTGTVETFVANDKVRGERVLVHIVECGPQKPEQTTSEWALESFRRSAPEPPGPVLETGKYSGTKYAYVVTRSEDDAALKAWVRRYEIQAQETKETKVHALKTEGIAPPAVPPMREPVPFSERPPAPVQMTQLFRDFDSLAKSKAAVPAAPASEPPFPIPSTSLPGESGLHPAAPWDPVNARVSTPPQEAPLAVPPSFARSVAPELQIPGAKGSSKPGEFTSFFQGPFRPDSPSDVPAFSSQPIEPPRKSVGEFTALFGQATTPSPASESSGNKASGPSFTGLFKDMESAKPAFNASMPMPGGVMPPPIDSKPASMPPMNMTPVADPVFAAPQVPVIAAMPPAPVIPPFPNVPAEKPLPPRPSSLPGDAATGAFMQPRASEPPPVAEEVPTGPSPYTQIISRSKIAEAEQAETEPTPGGKAGAGKFAAPSMPKIPAAAPPPMPKMPPPPKVAAPAMPKIAAPAAPKAPKAPKVDVAAPPPVSYWPLILTLTVLFFLAVLLVLYFVLKH